MENVTERVHIGLDNDNVSHIVTDNPADTDFIDNDVSEMVLVLNGTEYKASEGYFKYFNGGRIEWKLEDIGLVGFHQVELLKVIDPDHPKGQPLVSFETPYTLAFNFV